MALGDILQVQFDQSIDSDNIQNQFYYKVEQDDDSGANDDPLALAFENDVIPLWQPCVTGNLSMDCIGTQKVFPEPKTAFRERFLTALGTAVGENLPIAMGALIQKFDPNVSGTGKKGHVTVAGISEADTEAGRIDSSLNGLLFSLAAKLNDNLLSPNNGIYKPVWAVFSAVAPIVIEGSVDWIKSVVMPRLAHIGTRKTPIRKLAP